MIVGVGHDIVHIERIENILEKQKDRFLFKYFSLEEIETANKRRSSGGFTATIAKRFAAKEAAAKALGTGFRNGLNLKDIIITNNNFGKPCLSLTGEANNLLHSITPEGLKSVLHVSLSDDHSLASAFVIIEALPA